MVKMILTNREVHKAIVSNASGLLKLGAIAAVSLITGSAFRTQGHEYLKTATKDYNLIKEVIQDARL